MEHFLVRIYCIISMNKAGINPQDIFKTCFELDKILDNRTLQKNEEVDEELIDLAEKFSEQNFYEYLKIWGEKNPESVIFK